ncbi:MAG: DUF2516 family protein [Corynebacterium sp.]|nr:DUF2516 family protein [Corynebacterium sp.]
MDFTLFRVLSIVNNFEHYLLIAVAAAAVVGVVLVCITREDAFRAGDRQPKYIWAAILAASALAMMVHFPFLAWIGAVATGVYWFDVRPQLRDIQNGNYGY